MNTLTGIHAKTGKAYTFTAPDSWNEMSGQQLITWAAICLKKMPMDYAIRLAMLVFYRIPTRLFFNIPQGQLVQLAPTLRFLFAKNTLVKWLIPELCIVKYGCLVRRFYGPEDRLANITIAEFRRAEFYYQAYEQCKDNSESEAAKLLDLLIATLYRPKRKGKATVDIREDLNEHGVRRGASWMRRLSPARRHAILLNYEGCRLFVKENYLDRLPGSKGKATGIFDFNDLIRSVAGSKFGTYEQTERAMLYDFLKHLVETAEEVERIKKSIKTAR